MGYYAELRKKGLCWYHKSKVAVDGKSVCQICIDKLRANYQANKEAGICVRNGCKNPCKETSVLCSDHTSKENIRKSNKHIPKRNSVTEPE